MTLALWDVDQLEAFPAVREMVVSRVSAADVDEFAHRYHYTGTGLNANWRWGLWHDAYLLGVISYNLTTPEASAVVFGQEHQEHVWHMGRLALPDAVPANSESRLIGGSLRAISREYPHVWAVLTYAAQDQGHIGYVYQATNALYTGLGGGSVYLVDTRGKRRSDNLHACEVKTVSEARAMGWTVHKSLPKHRYVYLLGSARQRRQRRELLRLPVLAYPKQSSALA